MKKHTAIIAGGGTGGHIYPALSIAKSLQELAPDIEIHFVGSTQGLEKKIIPRYNYALHLISVGKLNNNVNFLERIWTLIKMPLALLHALTLVLKIKPDFLIGVGGFASGPVLLMGALLGKKTFIWEANAYPGMANRWLSPFVDESLVVFDEAKKVLKSKKNVTVGMPVRQEIESASTMAQEKNNFKILIFGGSQGARSINNIVAEAVGRGGDWLNQVDIVHQTGPHDYQRVRLIYERVNNPRLQAFEYLHDMDKRYAWADLVVCRSGISTLAELAATGKAAVLVPFPAAADNHQQKNAEALVTGDAAMMILQKDLTVDSFIKLIKDLKQNTELLEKYSQNVKKFYKPQASTSIAQHVLSECGATL